MTLEGKKLNLDCFNSVDIVYWTYRVKMDHLNRRHVEFCLIDNIRRSDSGIAHERINKALEMDQDDPYLIMQSGLIALDRLMISDAQNAFTQVFEIIQQDVAQNSEVEDDNLDTEQWKLRNLLCLVLTWRGVTWKVMGNLLKAKQDIHQALSVFPSHPIALAQKTLMLALHAPLRTVLEPLGLLMNSVRKSIAPNLFGKAGTFSYSFLPERLRDDEALLAIGNTEEALPDLHCNAVVAETVDKMYNLGLARLMKNKIEVAYRYFKYAIMLRKTYIPQTVSAMADCRDANATALVCVEKLFERAQDLYDNSNWGDQVLTDLSTVIRMCPAFIDAVWLRAMVFKRVGNWLSCIDDLTVVIEHLEATNAEGNRDRLSRAYLCRGTLYREIGKNELALDDLSVSVASAENKAVALQYRSDVLIQMQRFSEARMDLQLLAGTSRAKDQRKADEILLCNLYAHQAIQHRRKNRTEDTMYSILSINERDTTPLISQGLSKAQQRLDLLIKADQDRNVLAILYYCRARVLALQGKAEAAFSDLTESITLNRKFESALFLRGTLRSQRGLMDLALSDFMILLHCNPKYPQLASSIGYCHYINGDYFKAFDFLSRARTYKARSKRTRSNHA